MDIGIIEGFFFKLRGGDIFYVKGVTHPLGNVVSFPKYIVDANGDRVDRSGVRYKKIPSINEEYNYATSMYTKYIKYDEFFCRSIVLVPTTDIAKVYNPVKKAEELIELSTSDATLTDVKDMVVDIIDSTGVKAIGVSGSVLVELHKADSDIDIVVYGRNNGFRVYSYLKEVVDRDHRYRRYTKETLKQLYLRRAIETPITFDQMLYQESRRLLEGFFKNREYFIRLVKYPWEEPQYSTYRCKKLGKALLKLRIVDSKDSIYTPCRYRVEIVEHAYGVKVDNVTEVYSLRGRFSEIATEDDIVEAYGTIELVETINGRIYHRLYLGDENDYMVVIRR
ncbi:MAG: nucleotidyltransferase domain-containing protein [Ignisphaera sp.]